MKEKILDNIGCQELKEMVERNEISLLELDSDTISHLMNYEIDMICYGKGDMDLIKQCTDILNSRDNSVISKDEFMDIIERTEAEHIIIVENKHCNRKVRTIFKRALLVAAIASALLFSSCCVLKFVPDICQYLAGIVRQPEGVENNVDEFTFYHNGDVKKYDSIEEMVAGEDLDIMYPTKWPEGVEVKSVIITNEINGNEVIQIFTSDTNTNINIELSGNPLDSSIKDVYVLHNIDFYIKQEVMYVANCYYNNNCYTITANTRDELILIIDNLKE